MRSPLSTALFALLMWGMLMLRFGYDFGTKDQIELLSYPLFLNDHSLYQKDFVIQGIHAQVPNERTVFCTFLSMIPGYGNRINFLLHFITTFFLICGLEQWLKVLFRSRLTARLAIVLSLLVFNDYAPGNNEIYTSAFQASNIACAMLAWSFAALARQRLSLALGLLIAASWTQVLEGLDVSIPLFISALWWVRDGELKWRSWIGGALIYMLLVGWYLIWIYIGKQSAEGAASDEEVFKILFEFRHPHHFLYHTFNPFRTTVYWLLAILGWYWLHTRREHLWARWLNISTAILISYIFCVDVLSWVFVANFQWYKTAQWIKLLGCGSLAHFLLFPAFRKFLERIPLRLAMPVGGLGLMGMFIAMFYFPKELPFGSEYQFVPGYVQLYADIDISQKARRYTPDTALFVQPASFTALKYHGQRSSYADFKAVVRHSRFVKEWYRRVLQVYRLSADEEKKGFEIQAEADKRYAHQTAAQWAELKQEGVTHAILPIEADTAGLRVLVKNEAFMICCL